MQKICPINVMRLGSQYTKLIQIMYKINGKMKQGWYVNFWLTCNTSSNILYFGGIFFCTSGCKLQK